MAVPPEIARVVASTKGIQHDQYIIGRGSRKEDGGVLIEMAYHSPEFGPFVEHYPRVERYDSVAQQFLCAPFLPIAIRVGASALSPEMNDYLRDRGISSLLLVGLESSRGLCWMTLYRCTEGAEEFSAQECELASYRVRAALFEWQMDAGGPILIPPNAAKYQLLPLGRRCLDFAVRWMRGIPGSEIRKELDMTEAAIDEHVKTLKKHQLTKAKLLEKFFGQLPPGRPPEAVDRPGKSGGPSPRNSR